MEQKRLKLVKISKTKGEKCGMENKYALAMYDIRGKQEFIIAVHVSKKLLVDQH